METKQIADFVMLAIDEALSNVHTATVAKVTQVYSNTINCKPVINRVVRGESIELPEFIEVPLIMLQGGGSYIAMPITVGDYCILFFTERCIDRWYIGQDFQPPLEMRMHDYSDGFALIGVNPFASLITVPQETTIKGVTRIGTESPGDFMALANKVKSELDAVKADLQGFKTVFDTHAHGGAGASPPAVPFPTPHSPGSVASSYVKAD